MEEMTMEEKEIQGQKEAAMIQQKLINNDEEETKLTIDYAKQMLALDLEIKELQDDKKAITTEAKDEGVSVAKVKKVISAMKAAMKANDSDLLEQELMQEVLGDNVDIRTQISELTAKK